MIYWGVSFGSHDAALSVFTTDRIGPIVYDRLIFASHSERFSRIKDDANLCQELIDHAIQKYGCIISDQGQTQDAQRTWTALVKNPNLFHYYFYNMVKLSLTLLLINNHCCNIHI